MSHDPHRGDGDRDHGVNHDRELSALLSGAVRDVEPGEALPALRRRTRQARRARRTRTLWYAGATAALATAAVAAAAVLVVDPTGPTTGVDPAGPASARSSASGPDPSVVSTAGGVDAVYYVGETPAGPRLYREFRAASAGTDPVTMLSQDAGDPDYRTLWPAGSLVSSSAGDGSGSGGPIVVDLGDVRVPDPGLSAAEARLAVQQVVYTVQAAYQVRRPVRFRQGGADVEQVYGVDTSTPVAAAPALDVLSHLSISDPAEGNAYAGSFTARGVVNGFEGTAACSLTGADGRVRWQGAGIGAAGGSSLGPWEIRVDLGGVPPGPYTFGCRTDDPGGGPTYADTRTVVVE